MNDDETKIGMVVDYHSMIDGPATKLNCVIESKPWNCCGERIVLISGVCGGVSLLSISKSKTNNI